MVADMNSEPEVLHLTSTPLAGAPGRIANALATHTRYSALAVSLNDYPPPLAGVFYENTLILPRKSPGAPLLPTLIGRASIIHVHNRLPDHALELVAKHAKRGCKFVYQTHSPLREGPLFFDRAESQGLPFSAHLTLPHLHHRFFPNHKLVPNLVPYAPSVRPLGDDERILVIYSPAHKRSGQRWSDKVSPQLDKVLRALRTLPHVKVLDVAGVQPRALFELRRNAHVTIDEIATGAFHQISMEGLAAGNVTVNNADPFAQAAFQAACDVGVPPPFFLTSPTDVGERLLSLVRNRHEIRDLQQRSYEYFSRHLKPERLVQRFVRIYDEVLG